MSVFLLLILLFSRHLNSADKSIFFFLDFKAYGWYLVTSEPLVSHPSPHGHSNGVPGEMK